MKTLKSPHTLDVGLCFITAMIILNVMVVVMIIGRLNG